MKTSYSVSVIIPVYNEEGRIADCLQSLLAQQLHNTTLEILIIDDDSKDRTLEICRQYPVRILRNGSHDWDIGKAIGINAATGDFLLFIDADNRLPDPNWLMQAVQIMADDGKLAGIQSWKFNYAPEHSGPIRYHALWGCADPLVYYLGKSDHLRIFDDHWQGPGKIMKDTPEHIVINFLPEKLPTIGSQGFLTRKAYFGSGMTAFHHTEAFINLIEKDPSLSVGFLKKDIVHLPYPTMGALLRHYVNYIRSYCRESNRYKIKRYQLSPWNLLQLLLITQTVIVPLCHSLQGYKRLRDVAWFYHVFLCLVVPWIYFFGILRFGIMSKPAKS